MLTRPLVAASDLIEDRSANGLRGGLALECQFKANEEFHRFLLGSFLAPTIGAFRRPAS